MRHPACERRLSPAPVGQSKLNAFDLRHRKEVATIARHQRQGKCARGGGNQDIAERAAPAVAEGSPEYGGGVLKTDRRR